MKTLLALVAAVGAVRLADDEVKDFPHWMNGFGGYKVYKRDIPARFTEDTDDTLMKSMYENYATEGKDATGQPNGHFWVTEEDAKRAADEVIGTHLHLADSAKESYLKENFEPTWKRFDVNEDGKIEIDRMPQFLRMICGNSEACFGLQ